MRALRSHDIFTQAGLAAAPATWVKNVNCSLPFESQICRLFQEVLARLDGRTEHFSVQNLSNLLLSAAVLQRRCISPAALKDAVAAIAGRGNRQEVGVSPCSPHAHCAQNRSRATCFV